VKIANTGLKEQFETEHNEKAKLVANLEETKVSSAILTFGDFVGLPFFLTVLLHRV